MNKLTQLKKAMSNPPPERLAKIEYKSYLLQGLGITGVCIMLIIKGYWYIIFALIFGVGVSYTSGITAYRKYNMIRSLQQPERIEEFENDVSPTRRRSKIIDSVMGNFPKWVSITLAVGISLMVIDPTLSRWLLMLLYPLMICFLYVIFYFFIFYWVCYPVYKRRLRI